MTIQGFTPIEGPYSNHVGGGMTHPVTGAVYFLVTWRENGAGPYFIQLWEDAVPYGDPKKTHDWAGEPWGYGTATWLPDGSLYVVAPGNIDGTDKIKPAIHIEPGVFPVIPLLGDITARVAALEWFFAIPGKLRIGPENATGAGGEIMFIGSKGETWSIDTTNGELRFFLNGPAGKWSMKLGG